MFVISQVLDHILTYSPSRISVLLCMTAPQIVNVNFSHKALEAISRDFENCKDSLRQLPSSTYSALRARTAAIWWMLLTKYHSIVSPDEACASSVPDNECERYFSEEQNLLLANGIFIEGSNAILGRVLRAILPSDTADTLISQHSVRHFLLSNESIEVVGQALDCQDLKIGQAFVTAAVARETLSRIMKGTEGQAIFKRLGYILRWVTEPRTASVDEMRAEMRAFAGRFTPLAVAALLLSANPPLDLASACDGILEPCMRHVEERDGRERAKEFLDAVLRPLCDERNRALAVDLFDVLASSTSPRTGYTFPIPELTGKEAVWNTLFRAMRDPAAVRELFEQARGLEFLLPFEASERLCQMYVNHYCGSGRNAVTDLDHHAALLKNDSARGAIFKWVQSRETCGPSDALSDSEISDSEILESTISESVLCLLWLTWWSRPWTSFPLRFLPHPQNWRLFLQVQSYIRATSPCSSAGLHGPHLYNCAGLQEYEVRGRGEAAAGAQHYCPLRASAAHAASKHGQYA